MCAPTEHTGSVVCSLFFDLDMEEEYRWLASQGDDELFTENEIEIDGHDNITSYYQNLTGPPKLNRYQEELDDEHSIYSSYLLTTSKNENLEMIKETPPQDLTEEKQFYDIDLMRSSFEIPPQEIEEKIHPSITLTKNHLEIAIIEIPNQNLDLTLSAVSQPSATGGDLDLIPENNENSVDQFSILHIGDRVYSVTSSLILFLQHFILTSSRYLLRSSLDLELTSQTQEKLNQMTEMSVKALNQLSTLKALGECLTESCYFAVDRTRYYTKWSDKVSFRPLILSLPLPLSLGMLQISSLMIQSSLIKKHSVIQSSHCQILLE
jgi:hypothetical protein